MRNSFDHYGYMHNDFYHHGPFNPDWYHGHPGDLVRGGLGRPARRGIGLLGRQSTPGAAGARRRRSSTNTATTSPTRATKSTTAISRSPRRTSTTSRPRPLPRAPPAPPQPQSSDWMPLGVFSLVQGNQTDSSAAFQLALSKSGDDCRELLQRADRRNDSRPRRGGQGNPAGCVDGGKKHDHRVRRRDQQPDQGRNAYPGALRRRAKRSSGC